MTLPLISPPDPAPDDVLPPRWSGPYGSPIENNRFPIAPSLSGSSFLLSEVESFVTNPSVEDDTSGWGYYGGTTNVVTRSRDYAAYGGHSLKIVFNASTPSLLIKYDPPSSAELVAREFAFVSVAVNLAQWDGGAITLSLAGLSGGNVAFPDTPNKATTTSTSGWQTLWAFYKNGSSATTALQVELNVATPNPSAGTKTVYVDGLLLTKGNIMHSYFDGSLSDATWSGVEHSSTSKRIVYPFNDPPPVSWYVDDAYADLVAGT